MGADLVGPLDHSVVLGLILFLPSTAMTIALICGVIIGIAVGVLISNWASGQEKPKGPYIPLDAPCPACGNIGCDLQYLHPGHVNRRCKHCTCVVTQPVVYPELFKK